MIEAGFLGGHVRDVGEVRPPARVRRHALLDEGHLEAEAFVKRPHPLGVPARQVVVDREHVHASPGERVEGRRHHGGERLAFARLHLDDRAHDPSPARR